MKKVVPSVSITDEKIKEYKSTIVLFLISCIIEELSFHAMSNADDVKNLFKKLKIEIDSIEKMLALSQKELIKQNSTILYQEVFEIAEKLIEKDVKYDNSLSLTYIILLELFKKTYKKHRPSVFKDTFNLICEIKSLIHPEGVIVNLDSLIEMLEDAIEVK